MDALADTGETAAASEPKDVRAELEAAAQALVAFRVNAVAECEHRLAAERAAVDEAQAAADKLAAQSEPDPPRFEWQAAADHCLADLIDFCPHLGDGQRAGLEAALEASGLLSARLSEEGGADLANGELVAIASSGVQSPLSDLLRVAVPYRLIGAVDAGQVAKLLESISADTSTGAATAAGVDGAFRVGALEGRHRKERAEFIGASARRDALERDRRAAAEALQQARAAADATETELAELADSREDASRLLSEVPATSRIEEATGAFGAAAAAAETAANARQDASRRAADAEREAAEASNELQRAAVTLGLPSDRDGLVSFKADLDEIGATLHGCRSHTAATARSAEAWSAAAGRWRSAAEDLRTEQAELGKIGGEHDRQNDRLTTIRGSIGEEYEKVVAERDRRRTEKETAETGLQEVRGDRDAAVERRAQSKAEAEVAAERRQQAASECEEARQSLAVAVATPGLLEAVAPAASSSAVEQIASAHSGAEGLDDMVAGIEKLLADGHNGGAPADGGAKAGAADVNSVYQSLRQRRENLGAGWDAEARQPGPSLPLIVEVAGPAGRAPLAEAARAASEQHRQLAGLLDQKQSDALRELLQGLIATETAEKVHGAEGLVELMNDRLASVTTAHAVGVRLRWRLSPELDAPTARMVELLAKRPDLRLEDDQNELRALLSERLDEAPSARPRHALPAADRRIARLQAMARDGGDGATRRRQGDAPGPQNPAVGGREEDRHLPDAVRGGRRITRRPRLPASGPRPRPAGNSQVRAPRRRLRQSLRGQPRRPVRPHRRPRPGYGRDQRAALGHPPDCAATRDHRGRTRRRPQDDPVGALQLGRCRADTAGGAVTGKQASRTGPERPAGNGAAAGDAGNGQPKARQLFSYITSPEWQEYRAILGVFADTFFADFAAEDVAAHPAVAAAGIEPDAVAGRLESLRRWGNLTVSSSVGAPASLDDYYRRRNRYLITSAGQEVHELAEGVLAAADEIGDVQAGRLRDLHRSLRDLAQQIGEGPGGDELADRVRRIFDLHDLFTSELAQFFAELNQWQNRYDLDAQEIQLFATVLVGYVSEKLGEIEQMTRPIARSLEEVLAKLDELIPELQTGLAARVDEAGLADSTAVRRHRGSDPEDWEHLAAWFRPPPGRPSRLDQLTRQAVAAVRTLTANVTRLSRVGLGAASRRSDFVKLAGFFDQAPTPGDAHRIAAAAFGLGSARSIGELPADADDPAPTTTPWRDAPRALVAVSLRARGERSQRGAVTPLRDRRAEREWIRQRRERERVAREAVAAELLACAGDGGHLNGTHMPDASFVLLRDLLGRSWHGHPPGAAVRSASADGVRCEVRRAEGARTVVECPDGKLTLHGSEVTVAPAAGTAEPHPEPAHPGPRGRM